MDTRTFNVVYKHTYDEYKLVQDTGTLDQCVESLIEELSEDWVKTGPVWTNIKSGTQMCIEVVDHIEHGSCLLPAVHPLMSAGWD